MKKEKYPLLFQRFPELSGKIPWMPITDLPTEVQKLDSLGESLNIKNLWIKRDDLSASDYGGNKPRKLEFILADVKSKQSKKVCTVGGSGTNHGLATAYYTKKILGLPVQLILFPQPVTEEVEKKQELFKSLGAEVTNKDNMRQIFKEMLRYSHFPPKGVYFIPPGGSSPLGNLGFVNAGLELAQQIEAGQLPTPDYIFAPLGSMGTVSGLFLGLSIAGIPAHIMAVAVIEKVLASKKALFRTIARTKKLLKKKCLLDPFGANTETRITILHDYVGKSYGTTTPEAVQAIEMMKKNEGITLDGTYTGKCFAGLIDVCQKNSLNQKNILFIHTYNSRDLNRLVL